MSSSPKTKVLGLPVRLVEFCAAVAGVVGTAGLALASLVDSSTDRLSVGAHGISKGWLIGIGLAGLAIAGFLQYRIRSRYRQLTAAVDELREESQRQRALASTLAESEQVARDLLDRVLRAVLASLLHDNGWRSAERISLFVDSEEAGGPILVARYSDTRAWGDVGERDPYPYDRGCLGLAMSTGDRQYVTDLPHRASDRQGWIHALHERCGYTRQQAAEFTMPMRTIYSRPITAEIGQRPVGVIVLESERIPRGSEYGDAVPNLEVEKLDEIFLGREQLLSLLLKLAHQLRRAALENQNGS